MTPTMCSYKTMSDNGSVYNTPPCFNIYMCGLFFRHMIKEGGLSHYQQLSDQKSKALYDFIESSDGFYSCPIDNNCRSRMNIVFILKNDELCNRFLVEAKAEGLISLGGHKSVGGCRASLYNGMPMEGVLLLIEFMKKFNKNNI